MSWESKSRTIKGGIKYIKYIWDILISYCCYNKLPQTQWLKQHRFTILHFQGTEVQTDFHWVKIMVLAGLYSLHGLQWRIHSLAFSRSRGTFVPSSSPKMQHLQNLSLTRTLLSLSLIWTHVVIFVPIQIIWNNIPISRFLTSSTISASFLLPVK